MNWKKTLKYTGISFILLLGIGILVMTKDGKRMYGGLTKRVNSEQFSPKNGSFAIVNVNIVHSEMDSIIPDQTVLIENGLISKIGPPTTISAKTEVIDAEGKYLIPGLIDTHVHLFQSPNDLLLYLANGVTEIRELIGEEDHLKWRDEIDQGKRLGPKMFVASPRLGSFKSMEGWFMSWSQGYMNVQNAQQAREKVQSLHDKGYDGIKIYSQINKESYMAVLQTADSLGMPVFGHIPWQLELAEVWKNGQRGIAHFEELMNALSREFSDKVNIGSFYGKEEEFLTFVEDRCASLAENLKKHDIAVTSTLWLTESFARQPFAIEEVLKEVELEYENPGISEWVSYIPQGLGWLPEVNRYKLPENLTEEEKNGRKKYWKTYTKACQILANKLSSLGVKIMTGTDSNLPPAVPGFSLHDELQSLNRAGMSTAQILQSATAIPAAWLKSNSGKIETGYRANLVLLDNNPLENIANTKTINMVINNGLVYDRDLLDSILASVKEANDASRKVNIDRFIK
ncbi:amidohydrolase family protein [Flagellimonas meishanensis]|uniref:amidohydrolase family protein n=1 Tax=Flagellimonas meishanensis TaxID=2873264 RepID=UPI001CA6BB93|nr:amidohydrolase family protein [[Muricauda] meishanensis]